MIELLTQANLIKKANASSLTIETITNSKLQFFTMENPTAIRGYTVHGLLVLDEAAFFPKILSDGTEPFGNIILPITKAKKPKVLVISTPNGKQGMFYDLYLKAINGEQGYKQITATIYDDELVSEEEIDLIKQSISPLAFEQEFLVSFLDSAITVFPSFEKRFILNTYSQSKCWCGIDPSSVGSDDTVITFINDRNEVKQYKVDGTLDSKYRQLAELINRYQPQHTYCESNAIGEVMANEIQKQLKRKSTFSTFSTTNETKKEQVGMLATAIANNAIVFEKDNTLLYSELATFTYQVSKTGKVIYGAKAGYHDDAVMSLCIALQCREDNRQSPTLAFLQANDLTIR